MSAWHLRFGWIARERLAEVITSPALASLRAATDRRPEITEARSGHRDLERVRAWARNPRLVDAPTGKLLRAARTADAPEAAALLAWVEEVVGELRAAEADPPVPHDELVACLEGLAATDFPVFLLVSQPELAVAVFGEDGTTLTAPHRVPGRRTTRALLTCLGYALGGVGRMSPRDAWIGVAFGDFNDCTSPTEARTGGDIAPICLDRADEQWLAEPDLRWFARRWQLAGIPVEAGETAWGWLARAVAIRGTKERIAAVSALRARSEELTKYPRDYVRVRMFLAAADAVLRATVDEATWAEDPHRCWFTRIVSDERRLPEDARGRMLALLKLRGDELADLRVSDDAGLPRVAYPMRVAAASPADVIISEGEFFDWVVSGGVPLRWSEELPDGSGAVVSLDEGGARLDCVDPNPRRSAERFAAVMAERPRFCAEPADRGFVGLRPPAALVDNRVIRLGGEEVDPSQARPGDAVLSYTALQTREMGAALALEVASPRYDRALDLVPRTMGDGVAVSFGRVDAGNGIWLLTADDVIRLRERVRRARTLAAVYHLEVRPLLLSAIWLTVLLGGRRTAVCTDSLACWFYLLHELRAVEGPVALTAGGVPGPRLFVDGRGQVLPAQFVIR